MGIYPGWNENDLIYRKENECYPPTPLSGGTKAKRFIPPTVDEVAAYCQERGNGLDPESFVDFYASKGWMVGKNPMKDWKAAVRTWERSEGRGCIEFPEILPSVPEAGGRLPEAPRSGKEIYRRAGRGDGL